MTRVLCRVTVSELHRAKAALADRGANGGCLGNDARRLATHLPPARS